MCVPKSMPSQKGLWSSYALAGACTLTTAVGVLAARQLPPAPREDSQAVRKEAYQTMDRLETKVDLYHEKIRALKLALKQPFDDAPVAQWVGQGEPPVTRKDYMVPWETLSTEERIQEAGLQAKASHIERVLQNLRARWSDPSERMKQAIELVVEIQEEISGSLAQVHADQDRAHRQDEQAAPSP